MYSLLQVFKKESLSSNTCLNNSITYLIYTLNHTLCSQNDLFIFLSCCVPPFPPQLPRRGCPVGGLSFAILLNIYNIFKSKRPPRVLASRCAAASNLCFYYIKTSFGLSLSCFFYFFLKYFIVYNKIFFILFTK